MERRVPEGARRALEGALEGLSALAAGRGDHGVAGRAAALRERLAADRLVVAVVGGLKRGKTTFVNALLGADVLPTAAVPLTSVPTLIGWGEQPAATVRYRDGRSEAARVDDLEALVTERGNPGNRRGVAGVEVAYPAELLRGGALLVDTPGVGSVHRANTETARSFLRKVDAAILLTSADPPISEAEVAFLREVRGEAARVLFVMNRMEGTVEAIRAGIDRALADRRRSEERLRALGEEAARAVGDLAAIEERLDELDRVDRSEAAG
ncbi:MAG TPA: dynamin family protein [Actinomycetota bacterium]|nr:dynamin family protein [Actinomycetota bacterium]